MVDANLSCRIWYEKLKDKSDYIDDHSSIFLGTNGKYESSSDSTWFEEERRKNEKIRYDKDADVYEVSGPNGFNTARPGDLIVRFQGDYFVLHETTIYLFLFLICGSCFTFEDKED